MRLSSIFKYYTQDGHVGHEFTLFSCLLKDDESDDWLVRVGYMHELKRFCA